MLARLLLVTVCVSVVLGFSNRKFKRAIEDVSDECQKLLASPEIDDDTMTKEELVCVFWQLEGTQEKAEAKAEQALQDGDTNGNGAIDAGESF